MSWVQFFYLFRQFIYMVPMIFSFSPLEFIEFESVAGPEDIFL
ncbi:hypothetical protein [Faecalibaculum rodentium]